MTSGGAVTVIAIAVTRNITRQLCLSTAVNSSARPNPAVSQRNLARRVRVAMMIGELIVVNAQIVPAHVTAISPRHFIARCQQGDACHHCQAQEQSAPHLPDTHDAGRIVRKASCRAGRGRLRRIVAFCMAALSEAVLVRRGKSGSGCRRLKGDAPDEREAKYAPYEQAGRQQSGYCRRRHDERAGCACGNANASNRGTTT